MTALALAVAFLLGSLPFGYLIYRHRTGGDLRRRGSGNIGATNVSRSLGPGAGLLTLCLDVGKGAGAVGVGRGLGGNEVALAAAAAAVLGHVFTPWLRFRGGKGVATSLGAFLVLDPRIAAGAMAVFLVTVLATRLVSLGSLLGVASAPLLLQLLGAPRRELLTGLVLVAIIIWRHRENLVRLRAGVEPRLALPARSRVS